jgi:hypothetical protein
MIIFRDTTKLIMHSPIKFLSLLLIMLSLGGCFQSSSPKPVLGYNAEHLDSYESRIVIYREANQSVEDRNPYLYLDGVNHGPLLDNTYMVIPVDPGEHTLVVKKTESLTNIVGPDKWPVRTKTLKFKVSPGQEKFARYTVRLNKSVFDWHDADFRLVKRKTALFDLSYVPRAYPEVEEQN